MRIVYLEPVRGAAFRSRLRADTLWGALCWNVQTLYGDAAVEDFIAAYGANSGPLHLSSAFPYCRTEEQLHHFLPSPLAEPRHEAVELSADAHAIKQAVREHKRAQKGNAWTTWEALSTGADVPATLPRLRTDPLTHTLVDRSRLGTLTVNGNGQLYHTLENRYRYGDKSADQPTESGLYFFVRGDHPTFEPALRYLSVNGLGGDRSSGKGHFRYRIMQVDEPAGSSAADLNLALYYPAETGGAILGGYQESDLLRYRLEPRQGRALGDGELPLAGRLHFAEGSVFPSGALPSPTPGRLLPMRRHPRGHTIYRYGYGFALPFQPTTHAPA